MSINAVADNVRKQTIAEELEEPVEYANELAEKMGLEPGDVQYWIVDYDEMNQAIAYDGFQERYPHWRWGMKYDQQKKKSQHTGAKAFEIVINDDPAHAYLQESNTTADQKAVITHVEGHDDFFKNNRWFQMFNEDGPNAAAMLENHARRVKEYMDDREIDREAVEEFIDSISTLEEHIDQRAAFEHSPDMYTDGTEDPLSYEEHLKEHGVSDDVIDAFTGDEEIDEKEIVEQIDYPVEDVLAYLHGFGKQYDENTEKAVEMRDWQNDILDMMRTEAYYFAPQRMTKVMNEGWAAYWESAMMTDEAFAGDNEVINYADHMAKVLGSPGLNPYKLGLELWKDIENRENRQEVATQLLRVGGRDAETDITPDNFYDAVDFDHVLEQLEPDPEIDQITSETLDDLDAMRDDPRIDSDNLDRAMDGEFDVDKYPWMVLTRDGLVDRHYSLTKPENRGFLEDIGQNELEMIFRRDMADETYRSVDAAIDAVDMAAGWDKILEVRANHNDTTFLDEFLTDEFITENDYFTYEHSHRTGQAHVASTDPDDVKKKLMLQFTNFGKPTINVEDGNFENRNELLLQHQYNGVVLDHHQAVETLKYAYNLWGRPVNLKTIDKDVTEQELEAAQQRNREPQLEETGLLIRYDGDELHVDELPDEDVENIQAVDIDYNTKPDDWL